MADGAAAGRRAPVVLPTRASSGTFTIRYRGNAVSDEMSVRFTGFRVTGSTELRSDYFACDCLPR